MKIFIAIPCYGSVITSYTSGGLFMTSKMLDKQGIESGVYFVNNESYIPQARNVIADSFMNSDFTHLLSIDADVGFREQDVQKLIDLKVDFAAGAYRYKNNSKKLVYHLDKNGEIESVGAGFCLLSRKVFMDTAEICHQITDTKRTVVNYYGPIITKQKMYSEDVSFCLRWRKVGGKIHMRTDVDLVHYGLHGYANNEQ